MALVKYVEEDNVAGLKFPTANYAKPLGNLFKIAEEPSGAIKGGDTEEKTKDDVVQDNEDDGVRHPRGGSPGGCAGPSATASGAAKAGGGLIVLLLIAGGFGRFWRRKD
jgi:hypothetical protein